MEASGPSASTVGPLFQDLQSFFKFLDSSQGMVTAICIKAVIGIHDFIYFTAKA